MGLFKVIRRTNKIGRLIEEAGAERDLLVRMNSNCSAPYKVDSKEERDLLRQQMRRGMRIVELENRISYLNERDNFVYLIIRGFGKILKYSDSLHPLSYKPQTFN